MVKDGCRAHAVAVDLLACSQGPLPPVEAVAFLCFSAFQLLFLLDFYSWSFRQDRKCNVTEVNYQQGAVLGLGL